MKYQTQQLKYMLKVNNRKTITKLTVKTALL